MAQLRGYRGKVTLQTPQGAMRVKTHGRSLYRVYDWSQDQTTWVEQLGVGNDPTAIKKNRRFHRLLSKGWKVLGEEEAKPEEEKKEEEEKKSAKGKTEGGQEGNAKQGHKEDGDGKESQGQESKDPKEEKGSQKENGPDNGDGQTPKEKGSNGDRGQDQGDGESQRLGQGQGQGYRPRGCRGGRSRSDKAEEENTYEAKQAQIVKWAKQQSRSSVFVPTPPSATKEELRSAAKSAELLKELVGRSMLKTHQGTTVDVEGLLVALEVGDNPLPPLEVPREQPTIRVLITPDCSGSTQGWSHVSQAWAVHLSNLPDVEVDHVINNNGWLKIGPDPQGSWTYVNEQEAYGMFSRYDVVVYLGDGDGLELCRLYAERGATVVGLDCYAAKVAKPRIAERRQTRAGGSLSWVTRCSAKETETWHKALKLVLQG